MIAAILLLVFPCEPDWFAELLEAAVAVKEGNPELVGDACTTVSSSLLRKGSVG